MSSRSIRGPLILSNQTVYTGTGNVSVVNESVYTVKKAVGEATTVTLPAPRGGAGVPGHSVWVKDGKGDAATNNITVVPDGVVATTIDGQSSMVINQNYGHLLLNFNGTEWNAFTRSGTASGAPTTPGGTGVSVATTGGAGGAGSGTTAGGPGGSASVIGGAGGAKSGTGAAAGGAGGVITITGGAGGATASSGSDAGGAGATVTITGGAGGNATAGTGNGGAGGNVNVVPGAGGTSSGGTAGAAGEVQFNGAGLTVHYFQSGAASATNETIFLATRSYRIKAVKEIHDVAAGGTSTLQIFKDTGTTAMNGGTNILQSDINLNATARTVQTGTLSATASVLLLTSGDRLSIKFVNAIQSTAGLSLSIELAPM